MRIGPSLSLTRTGGVPFYADATVALDFANSRYRNGLGAPVYADPSLVSGWTYSRTGTEYAQTSSGLLVPFGSGVPAVTDLGLQAWEARTEVVLWNRDLTNAAWVKSSTTAALDQAGVDGAANSASSVTATGANGTVLQSITLASSARASGAWVKRLVGSGAVSMTMDNGATYTAVTVTAGWTFVSIPTQTLANPVVGFKLATSGDKIAVDFAQNQNGTFCGPSILTTSAGATRGAASASVATPASTAQGTVLLISAWKNRGTTSIFFEGNNTSGVTIGTDSGGANARLIYRQGSNRSDTGPVGGNFTDGQTVKMAAAWDASGALYAVNGTSYPSVGAPGQADWQSPAYIGSRSDGTLIGDTTHQRVIWYPTKLSQAQINALSQ